MGERRCRERCREKERELRICWGSEGREGERVGVERRGTKDMLG